MSVMDQEAQRVWALSKGVRADMCWAGRQEIVAVMPPAASFGLAVVVDVTVDEADEAVLATDFFDASGPRCKLHSSHQSSSVTAVMLLLLNHFLSPSGTKKCAFGCVLESLVMVGWERWS